MNPRVRTLLLVALGLTCCSIGAERVPAPEWLSSPPAQREILMVDEARGISLVAYRGIALYDREGQACIAVKDSRGTHDLFCSTPVSHHAPHVFHRFGPETAHSYLVLLGSPTWTRATVGDTTESFTEGVALLLDVDLTDVGRIEIETTSGSRSCDLRFIEVPPRLATGLDC